MSDTVYMAGSECRLTFETVDENGLVIQAQTYSWAAYDETGASQGSGSGTALAGADEIIVDIPATSNEIQAGERMGARLVELVVTDTEGDTFRLSKTYLLRSQVFLSVPAESSLTLLQAMLAARGMPTSLMESWTYSSDLEREAALIESWKRISSIAFDPFREFDTPDENLSDHVKDLNFAVNELSISDWELLPAHFRKALNRTQVIEAAVILGGDPIWDNRQGGLISKSVGESSEMFRTRPPAPSILSPQARREIASYINSTMHVGRA